ncbi:MAG: hypothetical protein DBX59_10900 [Bacillota bacterium]|nr:MAG: hypothetical protein DBX59_10900 [Bacillota bacterium]
MERILEIYSRLRPAKVFADIGCDHGLVAELAAKNALAEKIYITDISAECLKKAEKLLKRFIDVGTVESVVCDGFSGIEEPVDEALIAGMGGEEIVKILSSSAYRCERLVLQPMKNPEKVRAYLVGNGYKILEDVTFRDVKYYDIVAAERGEDELSEEEILFGRTNLAERPQAFIDKVKAEIEDIGEYLKNPMNETSRAALTARREKLRGIL